MFFGAFHAAPNILPAYTDPTLVNTQVNNIAKNGLFGNSLQEPGNYIDFKFEYGTDPAVGSLAFFPDGSLGIISYDISGSSNSSSAVPEPASWTLLMAGVGAAAAVRRRLRRNERLATAA